MTTYMVLCGDRASKYQDDRYVVNASMLGIGRPPESYDRKTEEARVSYLFRHFDASSNPTSALFAPDNHLAAAGYRWAPSLNRRR
jgi:hypothetical protein